MERIAGLRVRSTMCSECVYKQLMSVRLLRQGSNQQVISVATVKRGHHGTPSIFEDSESSTRQVDSTAHNNQLPDFASTPYTERGLSQWVCRFQNQSHERLLPWPYLGKVGKPRDVHRRHLDTYNCYSHTVLRLFVGWLKTGSYQRVGTFIGWVKNVGLISVTQTPMKHRVRLECLAPRRGRSQP
jgi:hypothetical protein